MTSNTATIKRDPYADLPPVASFSLESSLVGDGETMPIAQRDRIFGCRWPAHLARSHLVGVPGRDSELHRDDVRPGRTNPERVLALGGHQHSCFRHVVVSRSRRRGPDIAGRINAFAQRRQSAPLHRRRATTGRSAGRKEERRRHSSMGPILATFHTDPNQWRQ
jgi:hypothetical protein